MHILDTLLAITMSANLTLCTAGSIMPSIERFKQSVTSYVNVQHDVMDGNLDVFDKYLENPEKYRGEGAPPSYLKKAPGGMTCQGCRSTP